VSKNLWDTLLSFAELSSVRFVTGSRRRLREICQSRDSQTSDFWRIFADPPFLLGAYAAHDWDPVLAPLAARGIILQPGARTEVVNWTGGIPVLVNGLCGRIWTEEEDRTVTGPEINEHAVRLLDEAPEYLRALWEDPREEERGDLATLATGQGLPVGAIPRERLQSLRLRGYVAPENGPLRLSCRLMERYAREHGTPVTDLRRLFGDAPDYLRNMRGVLELRLAQIEGVPEDLASRVLQMIDVLHQPDLLVERVRGLVNRAFFLVWQRALPHGRIPEDWTEEWRFQGERNPPAGGIPDEGTRRCYLLRLITDPRRTGRTPISRQTYLLLNYLQPVGDFGQHLEGEEPYAGFAVATCQAGIELVAQLARELRETP
jgi:hypothetical protein